MTRTELFEIASTLGEKLMTETNGSKIDAAIAAGADESKIDDADYQTFKSDVLTAKHQYFVLGQQKLQSEINAAQAAQKAAAQKPTPAA